MHGKMEKQALISPVIQIATPLYWVMTLSYSLSYEQELKVYLSWKAKTVVQLHQQIDLTPRS